LAPSSADISFGIRPRGSGLTLTSIDYSKMSDQDKAKEFAATKRTDADYGLSWIRREGRSRVFYEAHGHSETVYAIRPMLEHVLAGVQCALGDLKADDSPSAKPARSKPAPRVTGALRAEIALRSSGRSARGQSLATSSGLLVFASVGRIYMAR